MLISMSNAVSINKFLIHVFVYSSCATLFLVVATSKHVDLAIVDIIAVILNRVLQPSLAPLINLVIFPS